jgi:hypothetical protein
MDEVTDSKKADLIRLGLADEQTRPRIMRDLFSPSEQVQLHALESLHDLFGEKCVSNSSLQKCIQHVEKLGRSGDRKLHQPKKKNPLADEPVLGQLIGS